MTSDLSSSLFIALGGAMGAVARFWTGRIAAAILGTGWPWGTFLVNVIGGLLIGAVVALASRGVVGASARQFLTVGVLGGFTTFSAFSLDVVQLMERGAYAPAVAYIIFSVVLAVAGVMIGMKVFA
jgi:fluoride exporter